MPCADSSFKIQGHIGTLLKYEMQHETKNNLCTK